MNIEDSYEVYNNYEDGVGDKENYDVELECFNLIPLRDAVVFPSVSFPLNIGRACSINAVDDVCSNASDRLIVLVTQKDGEKEEPEANFDDLYGVGVLARIVHILRMPKGQNVVKVVVEAISRVKIVQFVQDKPFLKCLINRCKICYEINDSEAVVHKRMIIDNFKKYVNTSEVSTSESLMKIIESSSLDAATDTISSYISNDIFNTYEKQKLLEILDLKERSEKICEFLQTSIHIIKTQKRIKNRVKSQVDDTHKKYYLSEQLKAIQKELEGFDSEYGGKYDFFDIKDLEEKIKNPNLSSEAKEKAIDNIKKLKSMTSSSAESTVVRNYLEYLLDMPWKIYDKVNYDIKRAYKILEKNHYGLENTKERFIEYIAVQKRLKYNSKGSIICLYGPPGVGKTSFIKSIAEAMGRKFAKVSLGGIRDEAEIRGHRKTYIGAMPGRIIQSIHKAGSSDPLILLDEIDKMGADFRGDPASALLEVLDNEHNSTFVDHYLEVEYDLSKIMFVATSNTLNIPHALMDRLELIRVSGYTEEEKINIFKKHLIPKVFKDHGIKKGEITVSNSVIANIIRYYTKESGVRQLKRNIEKISRKVVRNVASGKIKSVKLSNSNLKKYLGVKQYMFEDFLGDSLIGVVTGLAYTEYGGEILSIESVLVPGKGEIRYTGKLGEVMQESIKAAHSFILSRKSVYKIKEEKHKKYDIHFHIPEGATPKDGPSAGIAICTAIVSVLTDSYVNPGIAMTGEITLTGRVLPIGGVKEKLLAAARSGIKTVIIPEKNVKDLEEIPNNIKKRINIISVSDIDEVLKIALQLKNK